MFCVVGFIAITSETALRKGLGRDSMNVGAMSRDGHLAETIRVNLEEVCGNNRPVIPLDVLGHTRATFVRAT